MNSQPKEEEILVALWRNGNWGTGSWEEGRCQEAPHTPPHSLIFAFGLTGTFQGKLNLYLSASFAFNVSGWQWAGGF